MEALQKAQESTEKSDQENRELNQKISLIEDELKKKQQMLDSKTKTNELLQQHLSVNFLPISDLFYFKLTSGITMLDCFIFQWRKIFFK